MRNVNEIYGKAPLNNSANKWGAWWGFGDRHNDQSIYSTANHGPPPCSGPGASAPPSPMVNAALKVCGLGKGKNSPKTILHVHLQP